MKQRRPWCRGGFEIGVDIDDRLVALVCGLRYEDKRPVAKKMWATINDVLISIGALAKKDAA